MGKIKDESFFKKKIIIMNADTEIKLVGVYISRRTAFCRLYINCGTVVLNKVEHAPEKSTHK